MNCQKRMDKPAVKSSRHLIASNHTVHDQQDIQAWIRIYEPDAIPAVEFCEITRDSCRLLMINDCDKLDTLPTESQQAFAVVMSSNCILLSPLVLAKALRNPWNEAFS